MKDHDTNSRADIAILETQSQEDDAADDFDPALVFADPVAYLAEFGLRSVLAETRHRGYPAAA